MFNNKNKMRKKGFTLTEIIIAVGIIAIMASAIVFWFGGIRPSGRDSKRINDIKQLQFALEMYRRDTGSYPEMIEFGESLVNPNNPNIVYMETIPKNPTPRGDGGCPDEEYQYEYSSSTDSYAISFCLSGKTGNLESGVYSAQQSGIIFVYAIEEESPSIIDDIIAAAISDGGTLSNEAYLQSSANQMLDLEIWDNLTIWLDSGLVKTRTSGSDLFVSKVYDVSDKGKNSIQMTDINQPKLLNTKIDFDGSNDYIEIPQGHNLLSQNITVQMWINPSSWTHQTHTALITSRTTTSNGLMFFILSQGNLNFDWGNGSSSNRWNTGYKPPTNQWTFITFKRNGSGRFFYVNGTPSSSTVTAGGNTTTNTFLRIGADTMSNRYNFQGKINDIRIYDKDLSSAEIESIYNETKSRYGH